MRKEVQGNGAGHSQLTMQVVEHVRGLIRSGEVRPGDRLPPERELARKLKISRSSLRAGIGFLAAMGVLKSRHGAGTFVSDGPPALDASSLSVLGTLHNFLPWQMFEARLVIEASVAALAAERANDEHLAELAEEVAEMYAALSDPQEYLIHDVRFHRTVARAAGNPILAALMETITANLYGYRRVTVDHAQDLKESAEMHRDIYRAIRSRNPVQARLTMERHLNLARIAQDAENDAAEIAEKESRQSTSALTPDSFAEQDTDERSAESFGESSAESTSESESSHPTPARNGSASESAHRQTSSASSATR